MNNDGSNKGSESFNQPKGKGPSSGGQPRPQDGLARQKPGAIQPIPYGGTNTGNITPISGVYDPRQNYGPREQDPRYAPPARSADRDGRSAGPTEPRDSIRLAGNASVWVSGENGKEVFEALKRVAAGYGITLLENGLPVKGSWWQKAKLYAWRVYSSDTARQLGEDFKLRAEIEIAARDRAEIDEQNATTVATLIAAIDKQEEAVVIFGPTVIVKHDGSIFVREIDPRTASKLRQMPTLATSPEAMLRALSGEETEQETAAPQHSLGSAEAE
jgi:hypothetical protein